MSYENAICINVHLSAPYVTMKKYAELTGLSLATVKRKRAEGKLPILEKESKNESVLINLIAIAKEAATQE